MALWQQLHGADEALRLPAARQLPPGGGFLGHGKPCQGLGPRSQEEGTGRNKGLGVWDTYIGKRRGLICFFSRGDAWSIMAHISELECPTGSCSSYNHAEPGFFFCILGSLGCAFCFPSRSNWKRWFVYPACLTDKRTQGKSRFRALGWSPTWLGLVLVHTPVPHRTNNPQLRLEEETHFFFFGIKLFSFNVSFAEACPKSEPSRGWRQQRLTRCRGSSSGWRTATARIERCRRKAMALAWSRRFPCQATSKGVGWVGRVGRVGWGTLNKNRRPRCGVSRKGSTPPGWLPFTIQEGVRSPILRRTQLSRWFLEF